MDAEIMDRLELAARVQASARRVEDAAVEYAMACEACAQEAGEASAWCKGELAVLGGPGGSGKSTAASQGVLSIATGRPWLGWYHVGGEPGEAWYFSSEDTKRTLHRRIAAALEDMPPRERELASRFARFRALPSRYTLFRQDSRSKAVVPTDFWPSFRAKVMERRPRLIVLDPLSAVTRIAETDNTAIGDALDYLEELADDSGTCILYLHHTQKAPSLLKDAKTMEETLDQSAIRGAGAIVNSPRVAMLMYPLSIKLAQQCLLDASEVKSNGQIVVLKEVKKNGGMLAPARYFKHTSRMGLLVPCLNVRPDADLGDPSEGRAILKAQSLEEHARRLAEAVVSREQEDAMPRRRIAVTGVCVCMGMGDSRDKSRAIALQAQELGLVRPALLRDMVAAGLIPKTPARGEVLVPTAEALRRHAERCWCRPPRPCAGTAGPTPTAQASTSTSRPSSGSGWRLEAGHEVCRSCYDNGGICNGGTAGKKFPSLISRR